MRPGSTRLGAALVVAWLAGCGGDSPSRPILPTPTPTGLAAGTVLTVVSGETGSPVPGVTVNVGSGTLTTDGAGQVRLTGTLLFGSPIDIVHPSYLDRLTRVRAGVTQLPLWPRTSPTGVNEHYTATLVYTYSSTDPPTPTGTTPLIRLAPGTTQVVIVPSAEILADGEAMERHYRAVESATAATGGEIRYVLAPSRPPSGVVFETRIDPTIQQCTSRTALAITQGTYRNFDLVGGSIVFCDISNARTSTTVHEIGHTLGLQHSPDPGEVMGQPFSRGRSSAFGPREGLAVRLMLQRTAGNRFPDSDRGATGSAGPSQRVIACR